MATILDDAITTLQDGRDVLTGNSDKVVRDFEKEGFIVPPIPSADDNKLPSTKSVYNKIGNFKRHLIHWFVPQFGIVKMYVNPQSISYNERKAITSTRTKGGYSLQYWGEELMTVRISGNTGSSGIEGINVLREIYRAEQYAFDAVGLTLAADNANLGAAQQISSGLGNLIGGSTGGEIVKGIFGFDNVNNTLAAKSLPSLASLAFSVEMYYNGWVYRGYFQDFTVDESADRTGLFNYTLNFVATQRRGYRFNSYPWQHPATVGPSNNGDSGMPLSYSRIK